MLQNEKIIEENDRRVVGNITSIFVIFLRAKLDGQFRPDLSYHLHFIVSDMSNASIIACLDTGDIISKKLEAENTVEESLLTAREICSQFFEALSQSIHSGIEGPDQILFRNKFKEIYWNKFNEIKQNSFYKSMQAELGVRSLDIGFSSEEIYKIGNMSVSCELREYREVESAALAV